MWAALAFFTVWLSIWTTATTLLGDEAVADAESQSVAWDEHKRREREAAGAQDSSVLAGIPKGLPEWQRSVKLQKRAARTGFEWPHAGPVLDKLDEELAEVRVELDAVAAPVPGADRAPQARDALRHRVAVRVLALRGFDQLVDDVLRRRPVGIAHREVDDVLAAPPRRHLQLVGDVEDVRRKPLNP